MRTKRNKVETIYFLMSFLVATTTPIQSQAKLSSDDHYNASFDKNLFDETNISKKGNKRIKSFSQAKVVLPEVHSHNMTTIYCGCTVIGKKVNLDSCGYKIQNKKGKSYSRAYSMEWEHVSPAFSFGQSFPEWREGSPLCVKKGKPYKGRQCAEKNPAFALMEADLYNLFPEIGELNGLRNNYAMAEIPGSYGKFGTCKVKLEDRKFEPRPEVKGIVARAHLYMNWAYPGRGIISGKNEKLFDAWNKTYPVTESECIRAKKIKEIQGNVNPFIQEPCKEKRLPF